MPALEIPVKVGERYDVTVEATVSGTEGLARVKGFLVFVKDGKPGEKVNVEIVDISKRFASAVKV